MKIRCGSHQQNRSIVRPGLSLMATKVALTAEEFRENSQRSIALFNTEKLSTDSTHVLKSAYCILCISAVAICTGRVEAKKKLLSENMNENVAICTGRVEAKYTVQVWIYKKYMLQSARGVWRQSVLSPPDEREALVAICTGRVEAKRLIEVQLHLAGCCNLHGACGGKGHERPTIQRDARVAICTGRVEAKAHPAQLVPDCFLLQSARGVWRQRLICVALMCGRMVAICTGRVEAKSPARTCSDGLFCCNLHGACGGKACCNRYRGASSLLQSARGVWRQRLLCPCNRRTYRLQSARGVWRQRPISAHALRRCSGCNLHGACGGKGVKRNASLSARHRCNLHGACGGKGPCSSRRRKPGCRCNLHGACGGKAWDAWRTESAASVAICTERVEAK